MDRDALLRMYAHRTKTADQELLLRIHARDEAALGMLYDQYSGLVYTLALRVVGDRELAREVLQDAFMRCWDGAERYDPARGSVPGWLMGIARNRAIDTLRGRQHQARLREQTALPEPGSRGEPRHEDDTETMLLDHSVHDALGTLSHTQRQVIELSYYGGFSQTEIAERLDRPLGTVKAQMRTGMGRLRELLRPLIATGGEEGRRRG